jgi:hypothetical protein
MRMTCKCPPLDEAHSATAPAHHCLIWKRRVMALDIRPSHRVTALHLGDMGSGQVGVQAEAEARVDQWSRRLDRRSARRTLSPWAQCHIPRLAGTRIGPAWACKRMDRRAPSPLRAQPRALHRGFYLGVKGHLQTSRMHSRLAQRTHRLACRLYRTARMAARQDQAQAIQP